MRPTIASVAVFAVTALLTTAGTTAHAATLGTQWLTLTGGTLMAAPSENSVVGPQWWYLWDDAVLSTTANNVTLEWYFVGRESSVANTLSLPEGFTHTVEAGPYEGRAWPRIYFPGTLLYVYEQQVAGPVDMSFMSSAFTGSLVPGGGDDQKSIAFSYLSGRGTVRSKFLSNNIAFFLEDGFDSDSGPDFDDYVGYVHAWVAPVPAALPLLLSGLVGVVWLANRHKKRPVQD